MDGSLKALPSPGTPTADPDFFFAVDLGAAETAVAWFPRLREASTAGPEMLFLDGEQPAWITAYSQNSDGTLGELGWAAVDHSNRDPAAALHLAFKLRPDAHADAAAHLRRYSELLLAKISALPDRAGRSVLCVGCPSAWTDDTLRAYQELLAGCHASVIDVFVIRESRAAMHQALAELRQGVTAHETSGTLVIDIGSSTTDVTLIRGLADEIVDSGFALGAGLLDDVILGHLPEWQPSAAQRDAVLRASGSARSALLAQCRRAKERYFSSIWRVVDAQWQPCPPEEEQRLAEGQSERVRLTGGDGRPVKIGVLLEYDQMQQVLGTPIAALSGRTWPDAFRDFLSTIPDRLQSDAPPERIVLTGGGSKMAFVQQLVRDAFPGVPLVQSGDPSCMIAKGLARAADRLFQCRTFEQTMRRAMTERLRPTVEQLFEEYLDALSKDYASQLYNDSIKPEIRDWTTGLNSSIADTERYIKAKIRRWLASDTPKQLWTRRTEALLTSVANAWCSHEDVAAACRKFGLGPDALLTGVLGASGPIGSIEMPATLSDPDEMIPDIDGIGSNIVAAIGTVLVLAIAAMKAPLLLMGPIGWAVFALVTAAAKFGAEHVIREYPIPDFAREWILSEARRETLRRDIEGLIAGRVRPQFATAMEGVRLRLETSLEGSIASIVDRERRFVG